MSGDHTYSADEYYQSYNDLEVHKLMLEDKERILPYDNAIKQNRDLIKDKIVLEVGTGTGLLSVFCAKAGAKKVFAVEASDMYKVAEEVVAENGFSDVVEVIHGRIEDVDLPEKVDAIVSEWMGFYLLHEGMLDSIIYARDKFLKPDGLMFPESAAIYSAPCSLPSLYAPWSNVFGVSMQAVGKRYRAFKSQKPEIMTVERDSLLHHGVAAFWMDLHTVSVEDIETIYFQDVIPSEKDGKYQGICIWFTCSFPGDEDGFCCLDTGPENPPTHWKQTVIVLPTEYEVETSEPIAYRLLLQRSPEDPRKYNIEITMLDADEVDHPEDCRCYMTACILRLQCLKNIAQT